MKQSRELYQIILSKRVVLHKENCLIYSICVVDAHLKMITFQGCACASSIRT